MILLSPEEIAGIKTKQIKPINTFHRQPLIDMQLEAVAKAQLKRVVKWGQELCKDHNRTQWEKQGWHIKRCECPICWQDLEKELG